MGHLWCISWGISPKNTGARGELSKSFQGENPTLRIGNPKIIK